MIHEVVTADFVITSITPPGQGSAMQLDDTSLRWTIPALGVSASESATLEFFVRHVGNTPGARLVNESISYTDTEILSGIQDNDFNLVEARNCRIDVVPVDDFPSALDFPVNKMIVSGEPALLQTVAGPLQEAYKGRLSIYFSEPFYLEIMPLNVDKAAALDFLLKTMGLTAENLICCGDSYNDISMIEYAGLGVAMANAQPVVKKAADLITASNDEDGVLRVIEKYMMQT